MHYSLVAAILVLFGTICPDICAYQPPCYTTVIGSLKILSESPSLAKAPALQEAAIRAIDSIRIAASQHGASLISKDQHVRAECAQNLALFLPPRVDSRQIEKYILEHPAAEDRDIEIAEIHLFSREKYSELLDSPERPEWIHYDAKTGRVDVDYLDRKSGRLNPLIVFVDTGVTDGTQFQFASEQLRAWSEAIAFVYESNHLVDVFKLFETTARHCIITSVQADPWVVEGLSRYAAYRTMISLFGSSLAARSRKLSIPAGPEVPFSTMIRLTPSEMENGRIGSGIIQTCFTTISAAEERSAGEFLKRWYSTCANSPLDTASFLQIAAIYKQR